jgi:hypothetical protein
MRIYLRAGLVMLRYAPPYRAPQPRAANIVMHAARGFSAWLD